MYKSVKNVLCFCLSVFCVLIFSVAYGEDKLIVQSVKNNTGHTAIVSDIHYNGSGNHNDECVSNTTMGAMNSEKLIPLMIRIDRRDYQVYNTNKSCGNGKKYFAIQPIGGCPYDRTCLKFVKPSNSSAQERFVMSSDDYYVLNITFKKYTDEDNKSYYRPYLQYSNGDWCQAI